MTAITPWNDNGELIRISSPRQTRSYSYSTTGRLTGVHTTAANLDIRIPYATDPAGNRLPDPELHPDSTLSMWPDNRIARDAHYLYRYDRYGRLTEKTDLIPEGGVSVRMMSAPTGTITTVSTGWCTTRGHNMQSRWSKVAIFTTRWAAGWQNGYGDVNGT